jgi:Flp pilus assembly protein protease CpaA
MNWLLDPRIFNWIIMSLYTLNVVRWGIDGKPWNTAYWCGALLITLAVTFGYQKP